MPDQRLEWVEEPERLAALARPWTELADDEPLPFLHHAWLEPWLRCFAEGRRPAVAVLWRGDRLAGALPLLEERRRLVGMANAETPALAPLAVDDDAHAALLRAAAERGGGRLTLSSVPAGAPLERLERDLRAARLSVETRRFRVSPIVETAGDFEAWRRATNPRWKGQLDRLRRKAAREHDLAVELVRVPEDVDGELAAGLAVEASGWKGNAGTAVLADPRTHAFYTELARRYHALGELRFSRMALDGRLVAFDLSLLHDNRLWLLKTGFDPEHRRLAPGLVLRLAVIERCFELGLDALELLGDDEEWKRKFATTARETVVLHSAPRRSPSAFRFALRRRLRPALRRARWTVRSGA